MRAVHSAKHAFGTTASRIRQWIDPQARTENTLLADEMGTVTHPAVIRHPLSGREALFVNPSFTLRFEGWSVLRSAPLLAQIYSRVLLRTPIANFRWEPGSVAIWDNRATWHNAKNDYRGQRRETPTSRRIGCAQAREVRELGRHGNLERRIAIERFGRQEPAHEPGHCRRRAAR